LTIKKLNYFDETSLHLSPDAASYIFCRWEILFHEWTYCNASVL